MRIDVHHHFLPPELLADLKRRGVHWTGGSPPVPGWTPAIGREMMERNGIGVAIASVVPQVDWGDAAAAAANARQANEYGARVVQDDPQHWGYFATLPLPYVGDAMRELEYAYDTLKAEFSRHKAEGKHEHEAGQLARKTAVDKAIDGVDLGKLQEAFFKFCEGI